MYISEEAWYGKWKNEPERTEFPYTKGLFEGRNSVFIGSVPKTQGEETWRET
jgi:hypothetical protein